MAEKSRRAIVTPETKAESVRLRELWESRSHPPQAEFGEAYDIGNQSAVSQFLRGQAPLSLKAAKGFAAGLNCRIEDFSPRLAQEAASFAGVVAESTLAPDVAEVAAAINVLPKKQRDWVLKTIRDAVSLAQETIAVNGNAVTQTDSAHQLGGRRRAGSR